MGVADRKIFIFLRTKQAFVYCRVDLLRKTVKRGGCVIQQNNQLIGCPVKNSCISMSSKCLIIIPSSQKGIRPWPKYSVPFISLYYLSRPCGTNHKCASVLLDIMAQYRMPSIVLPEVAVLCLVNTAQNQP